MTLQTLIQRSLSYYWAAGLAVALGVTAGAAALIGALLVGDSMRASLLRTALERLGPIDSAMISPRFFRAELTDELSADREIAARYGAATPLILTRGAMTQPDSGSRVNRVNVFGVDERFWRLANQAAPTGLDERRSIALNAALADALHVKVGDDVLLSVGASAAIPSETLMGRRDQTTRSLRATVRAILPAEGLSAFAPQPSQQTPANAFISLKTAQALFEQQQQVNAILLPHGAASAARADNADWLNTKFARHCELADLGLRVRVDAAHGYAAVEADALLLEPPVETAALASAAAISAPYASVMNYLANDIALIRDGQPVAHIPYSTVAALDPKSPAFASLQAANGQLELAPGQIVLNDWAASDLGASQGAAIRIEYYALGVANQLETRSADFALAGVVPLSGAAADAGWTPVYKGVTDAKGIADWDPPFPVDLKRVRDKDEKYWDDHRATPKAYIHLDDARRLWAEREERFGRLNSIRIYPAVDSTLDQTAERFTAELKKRLAPASLGMRFEPLRSHAEQAAQGNTDFGGLFIGFSFFLIVSAAMLVALLFRLHAERRAKEIGLLAAIGFAPARISRALLIEGAWLAMTGLGGGVALAFGYAWLMLAGLRSWWSDAVRAPFLTLAASPATIIIGAVISWMVAMAALAWSLRGLSRTPPRTLLAGATSVLTMGAGRRRAAHLVIWAVLMAVAAIALDVAGALERIPAAGAFFGSGVSALIAALLLTRRWMVGEGDQPLAGGGALRQSQLGLRNARRNPGRSTLIVGLISSAAFVVVALGAFQIDADNDSTRRDNGLGGFSLYAEAAAALPHDLGSETAADDLGLSPKSRELLHGATVISFRLRSGDDASCRNLYSSSKPRVLGAPQAMIERGGFSFADAMQGANGNPWRLLEERLPDGAIPAIGDEAAVRWQMKLGLGQDRVVTDERGNDVRLRFVALLSGSALQDEIIISDDAFTRLFPSIQGRGFFLIDAPRATATELEQSLERDLSRFGFDAASLSQRLRDYLAVQNTYISTFQSLGGLGLLLGALGLIAVMLRNVWERRRELALLRAIGFTDQAVRRVVLAENVALALLGVLCGVAPALLAVAPLALQRPAAGPWWTILLVGGGVVAITLAVGALALRSPLRMELRQALATE